MTFYASRFNSVSQSTIVILLLALCGIAMSPVRTTFPSQAHTHSSNFGILRKIWPFFKTVYLVLFHVWCACEHTDSDAMLQIFNKFDRSCRIRSYSISTLTLCCTWELVLPWSTPGSFIPALHSPPSRTRQCSCLECQ